MDDTGLFEIPSRPTPRERYSAVVKRTTAPDAWPQVDVEIVEGDRVAASYHRNYGMLRTFEPFRQGQRDFALISPRYTATSIVDLASGEIIAGEEPAADGFCPAGFYVPDWWDVHSRIADYYHEGEKRVEFAVPQQYDLNSGRHID